MTGSTPSSRQHPDLTNKPRPRITLLASQSTTLRGALSERSESRFLRLPHTLAQRILLRLQRSFGLPLLSAFPLQVSREILPRAARTSSSVVNSASVSLAAERDECGPPPRPAGTRSATPWATSERCAEPPYHGRKSEYAQIVGKLIGAKLADTSPRGANLPRSES